MLRILVPFAALRCRLLSTLGAAFCLRQEQPPYLIAVSFVAYGNAMASNEKQYWFPAKRYGWGWGLPTVWQGWGVFVIYFVLILAGAVAVLPNYGAPRFVAYAGALTLLLVAICWVKGERPEWRWGGK